MTRIELGFERTVCACKVCVTNCKFMPGFLIPSDLERMMHPQIKPLAWAENNLLASPGALVVKAGQFIRIPTLVPAKKENGECINLMPDNSCGIHSIAPFGCAFFDCGPARGNLAEYGLVEVYKTWLEKPQSLYQRIWNHLFDMNRVQTRADILRRRMTDYLTDEIWDPDTLLGYDQPFRQVKITR